MADFRALIWLPLAAYTGRGARGEGLLDAEFYYDFTNFTPHPRPFSPGVPGRRGPELTFRLTKYSPLFRSIRREFRKREGDLR